MKNKLSFFVILGFFCIGTLSASEISLINIEAQHQSDPGGLSEQYGSLGGRFSQQWHERMFWFVDFVGNYHAYSSSLPFTPNDTLGGSLGGGVRYYFDRYGDRFFPFGEVRSFLKRTTLATLQSQALVEEEELGIYYDGQFGLRCSLDNWFFLDFQTPIFNNGIWSSKAQKISLFRGDGSVSHTQKNSAQHRLFANSHSTLSHITLSLGIRL